MQNIVIFPGAGIAAIDKVGGKGHSLSRMAAAGLPVPPGAVLTSDFFEPWLAIIFASENWQTLVEANPKQWPRLCAELKHSCLKLDYSPQQRQVLDYLQNHPDVGRGCKLYAVRSSSPQEDLSSASFAGGYETRLGVTWQTMDAAIRHCFASCFDARVLVYKQAQGFDIFSAGIAIVIQQQIDSEAAGVGFSINPLNNDYDQIMVEANRGLGESVVSGLVSPDRFIVDKVELAVVERKTGSKRLAIWLDQNGGTVERENEHPDQPALDDHQLKLLTTSIVAIEALYQKPMDIEWCFAGGELYILQARTITSYVPLPVQMQTKPGERRRLYIDAALSKGMTTNVPMSPMESAIGATMLDSMLDKIAAIDPGIDKGMIFIAGGRMYMNLSNMLWLMSAKKLAESSDVNDVLMGRIIENIDEGQYKAGAKPPWMCWSNLTAIPKALWLLRGCLTKMLWAFIAPKRAYHAYQRQTAAFEQMFARDIDYSLDTATFRRRYGTRVARQLLQVTGGALSAGLTAQSVVRRLFAADPQTKVLADKLQLGFGGNVVVTMGITLHQLARRLSVADFADLDALAERIKSRHMAADFMTAWDDFTARFGCRGPMEMDVASPRYADDPLLALRQMSMMVTDDSQFDPQVAHQRCVEQRHEAFDRLMGLSRWPKRWLLRRLYRVIDLFSGTRDTPKHQLVMFNHALRKRLLLDGQQLFEAGRLATAEQVFDLTLNDLSKAMKDNTVDVKQISAENTVYIKQLNTLVKAFPQVIDSRGRILRPATTRQKPGEFSGMGVSNGVVTGPVKVLHSPHEKTVHKGDILVAYTTDPGWTPLFVNAAAIILEIGGVLQHGAVVAREYGKPCVAGIERATERLVDGQQVEVDGTSGIVRVIPG